MTRYLTDREGLVVDDPQRDAEYTRGLGEELVRRYRALTVIMPTHIVARAVYDRIAAAHGTHDVYKLLRMHEGTRVNRAQVVADVARWQAHLEANPSDGQLQPRARRMPPVDIVNEAVRLFRSYHTHAVVERHGEDELRVGDIRLLYYYSNRTAHMRRAHE